MLEKIPVYELPFHEKKKLEFKIYRVSGPQIQRKDYPHKTKQPHKHSYYEICFFTGGNGVHEIDFVKHEILAPSIHFVRPGQVHLIYRGEEYKGYLIIFSEDFFNLNFENIDIIPGYPLVTQLENGPILNLVPTQYEEFFALIQNIESEMENNDSESQKIIVSYLQIFFLKLRRHFSKLITIQNDPGSSMKKIMYHFNQLVDKYYNKIHHVKEYAELLGESPVRLNYAIKSVTGGTASDIIIKRVILEAKRLLAFSDLSNKEVAYKLNYEDPSYFARIFRKKTGMTPTEFRTKMNAQYK